MIYTYVDTYSHANTCVSMKFDWAIDGSIYMLKISKNK